MLETMATLLVLVVCGTVLWKAWTAWVERRNRSFYVRLEKLCSSREVKEQNQACSRSPRKARAFSQRRRELKDEIAMRRAAIEAWKHQCVQEDGEFINVIYPAWWGIDVAQCTNDKDLTLIAQLLRRNDFGSAAWAERHGPRVAHARKNPREISADEALTALAQLARGAKEGDAEEDSA